MNPQVQSDQKLFEENKRETGEKVPSIRVMAAFVNRDKTFDIGKLY